MSAPAVGTWWQTTLADRSVVTVVATERGAGSLAVTEPIVELDARRRAIVDAPWTWLRQQHGAAVVTAACAGDRAGAPADGAVTAALDAPLVAIGADCAPIALVSERGIGVVHCGWRGLVVGVIPATVAAVQALGSDTVRAIVGPCIEAACYEFGAAELALVNEALGADVGATTAHGRPALDLRAGVEVALRAAGVATIECLGGCTACEATRWYSHRARADRGRHGLVVWRSPPTPSNDSSG